jgi:hypothetical protein
MNNVYGVYGFGLASAVAGAPPPPSINLSFGVQLVAKVRVFFFK